MKRIPVVALFLTALLAALPARAGSIPYAEDLAADAREARQRGLPVMVMFNADSCPYCELVMDSYIKPMVNDPAYRDKVIIRVVGVDSARSLIDFSGRRMDHEEFAANQGVTLTPVIKFFAADGSELTEELLGFTNEHFYGWYLDDAITKSRDRMRRRLSSRAAA